MTLRPALALAAAVLVLPVTPALAGPTPSALPPDAVVQRFDGAAHAGDIPVDVAVDPATGIAVVAGWVGDGGGSYDIGAAAYAADGTPLWHQVVAFGSGFATAVGIDSTRGIVYVAGESYLPASGVHYLVTAYDLGGTQLWQQRSAEQGNLEALRVDEVYGRVVVTGQGGGSGAMTIAYSSTGAELWVSLYTEPGVQVLPSGVAVDATSGAVYLAASVGLTGYTYRALALTVDGDLAWVDSLSSLGVPSGGVAVEVDPDDGRVYVTGDITRPVSRRNLLTAAYTREGVRLWAEQYDGPFGFDDSPTAMVLDPVANRLYISVLSGGPNDNDYLTVAYRTNGTLLWADQRADPNSTDDYPTDVAVDSGRGLVFVTGQARLSQPGVNFATVAYSYGGAYRGLSLYDGLAGDFDAAAAVAVDPVRHTVWVTGRSSGVGTDEDWVTIAYLD